MTTPNYDYQIGDAPTLTGTALKAGVPTNPITVVKFVCQKPDGTYLRYTMGTDPQITNPSPGTFQVTPLLDQGSSQVPWTYRYYALGTSPLYDGTLTGKKTFMVDPNTIV